MAPELQFDVRVKGCAAAAYKINEARMCLTEAKRVLMKTEDHLRQIRMMYHVLGIVPVTPTPPIQQPPNLQCPRPHTPIIVHENSLVKSARPVTLSDSGGVSFHAGQDCAGTMNINPPGSPRSLILTPTPVSNTHSHAHLMSGEFPGSVLAANALNFVSVWRKEDMMCTDRKDLIQLCLKARYDLELEEAGSRHRLRQLLLTVLEQMDRFVVMGEYSKFVVFCIDQEPVWRQAARQLQKENEARLQTTENIYSRFLIEEVAFSEKMRMFQEASDFVVSQCYAAREQRQHAPINVVKPPCNRKAEPQGTPVQSEPQSHLHHHQPNNESTTAASAGGSTPPKLQRLCDDSRDERSGSSKGKTSKNAKSYSTRKGDRYVRRWQELIWFFTNGERGKKSLH
ncbi:hypothetical protein, unknown function [Leishmania tarentolae]|uniref:Uncharacterized protein n=1 Tax=Leishmania tarentolae TaxID=5689 RepID=A0A640KQI2_LEITA|nr:hypothetical protein, unknown function [Leishmania tarentolae]